MRILKTVEAYEPFREMGGSVVKVSAIAHGLAQRGHEVTILTADLGLCTRAEIPQGAQRSRWGWTAQSSGVRVVYFPTLARYRALTWNPSASTFANEHLRDFDVIHIYGLYDLIGPAVANSARRHGVPYFVEPMGMFRPIVRNIALKRFYHRIVGQHLIHGARLLIATSPQEREHIINAGIPHDRIIIRRNGIAPPDNLPARGAFRSRHGISSDAAMILFLGRVVSKKSPDLLLQAFADWKNKSSRGATAVLIVAGPGEKGRYIHDLHGLASQLNVSAQVRFIGPLFDEDKWAAYRDADVFVLPSLDENFGNSAGESIVAGTPVILTDRCGIAPLLEESSIVISHHRESLAAALHAVLDDSSRRAKLAAGCSTDARGLVWAEPLAQMEEIYMRPIQPGAR